ncbi:sugar ABC transporter permease [Spirochaeta lutea]|nr:ABC transporter permease subunit [Spirochaeta lutea]
MALIVLSAGFLLPIIYTLSLSFSGQGGLVSSSLGLIPEKLTLENYRIILMDKPFFQWFGNSALLALGTVFFALVVAVPSAWAFSRFRFPGRRGLLYLFLLLNAFPSILSMVAIYRLFRTFGLMNSYLGLMMVYTGMMIIFAIWNMKGYFDTISISLEEAARIEGAGTLRILATVSLPLALPAVIVTSVLIFITTWNEYIYAVSFLTSQDKFTLAAGLYSLQGTQYTTNWPVFTAGAVIVTIPVLIVFFLIQRFMVGGLTAGGSKY